MRQSAVLYSPAQAHAAFSAIWAAVKPVLADGKRLLVTVTDVKKKREQEEKYHAMLGDIADQCEYHGRKLPLESWKRLMVEAMVHILREEAKAQGKPDPFPAGGQVLPSLDGLRIVQVEVLTRNFTVDQASQFIESLYAFGAERDVVWSEPERQQ